MAYENISVSSFPVAFFFCFSPFLGPEVKKKKKSDAFSTPKQSTKSVRTP